MKLRAFPTHSLDQCIKFTLDHLERRVMIVCVTLQQVNVFERELLSQKPGLRITLLSGRDSFEKKKAVYLDKTWQVLIVTSAMLQTFRKQLPSSKIAICFSSRFSEETKTRIINGQKNLVFIPEHQKLDTEQRVDTKNPSVNTESKLDEVVNEEFKVDFRKSDPAKHMELTRFYVRNLMAVDRAAAMIRGQNDPALEEIISAMHHQRSELIRTDAAYAEAASIFNMIDAFHQAVENDKKSFTAGKINGIRPIPGGVYLMSQGPWSKS